MKIKAPADCRVWLNGEEVTDRCYLADDDGFVGLYELGPKGKPYIDEWGDIVREELSGDVRIEIGEAEYDRALLAGFISP